MTERAWRSLLGFVSSFHPASMPALRRRNYQWEVISAAFIPWALACVEGGVIGVIAAKAFAAPDLVIAALAAAPAVSNLSSVFWARTLRGRDRAKAVVVLQLLTIACVALIALAPPGPAGLFMLVTLVFLARIAFAGVYNARSELWRHNFARSTRAFVTGRLVIVMSLVSGLVTTIIGAVLDIYQDRAIDVYRPLYLGAAALALCSAWAFSHVRWRSRGAVLAQERLPLAHAAEGAGPSAMLEILRTDHAYRRYMTAQFVLGLAQIGGIAPFVAAVARTMDYAAAMALTYVIPILTPVLTIPLWSRLLDRVHVVRFRVYHSLVFVLSNAVTAIALLTLEPLAALGLPLLYLARFIVGVGFGGGRIAWSIGHHDFAPRALAGVYTGIHVSLHGVRGVIAPFLGMFLYSGWAIRTPFGDFSWDGVGAWVFALFAGLTLVAAVLFHRLRRDMEREEPPDAPNLPD